MARAAIEPNLTADGRSQALPIKNTPRGSGATNEKTVSVTGTFGGGTATLQMSENGTIWFDVLDAAGAAVTFTANKAVNVKINSDPQNPVQLSINLAGATNPDLSMKIYNAS